jgi:hypothetical protein
MGMVNQDDAAAGIAAGTLIDGRYRVVRPIGQGGNGMVHEVEHLMTGRRLALKSLLDDAGLARLEQEARASALMKNGHAVKITDMGTQGPAGPYLVMELLDGQSLRELLDEAGQLPLELTVNIVIQICECLSEAHGLGIIHRDLKPDNVFLCASPWPGQYDVKVLDFGIVKIADTGPIPKSSLTRTGSTVGTPYYMSLEQLRNSSAVDARADIYSLGVVLYESLSGRKPFQAETIGDLVYALCSGPPTHLGRLRPDLPGDVCDLVMRTLSMNRDDRPATMADLATALLPHGNAAFGHVDARRRPASDDERARAAPARAFAFRASRREEPRRARPAALDDASPRAWDDARLRRQRRTWPTAFGALRRGAHLAARLVATPRAPPTGESRRRLAPPSHPRVRHASPRADFDAARAGATRRPRCTSRTRTASRRWSTSADHGDRDTPTRAFRTDTADFHAWQEPELPATPSPDRRADAGQLDVDGDEPAASARRPAARLRHPRAHLRRRRRATDRRRALLRRRPERPAIAAAHHGAPAAAGSRGDGRARRRGQAGVAGVARRVDQADGAARGGDGAQGAQRRSRRRSRS